MENSPVVYVSLLFVLLQPFQPSNMQSTNVRISPDGNYDAYCLIFQLTGFQISGCCRTLRTYNSHTDSFARNQFQISFTVSDVICVREWSDAMDDRSLTTTRQHYVTYPLIKISLHFSPVRTLDSSKRTSSVFQMITRNSQLERPNSLFSLTGLTLLSRTPKCCQFNNPVCVRACVCVRLCACVRACVRAGTYLIGFRGVMSTGAPGEGMSIANMSTHISTLPWKTYIVFCLRI